MTPEHRRNVERVYQLALAAPPDARAAVLAEACGNDATLRRQVESLLAPAASSDALEHTADIAERTGRSAAPLVGRRLGVFEIDSLIGVGGMGEVYKARDTRLGRDVAIKILPDALKTDPARVSRFEREARVLASLNHPHIAALYGVEEVDGVAALVMEFVEGRDLSRRGPMRADQALAIARQIALALEAAHEQGIVHRDLKPANITVRPDGTVKVLDFGLATALTPSTAAADGTTLQTQIGAILGTPAYMSPEQARGESVTRHTDIWAFGVVLYELLTGVSPFARQTTAETLASLLSQVPDYARLPPGTPLNVRRLIQRCLQKDWKRRLQHIGDARIELDETPTPGREAAEDRPLAAANTRRPWRAVAAVAIVAAALLLLWTLGVRRDSSLSAVVRFAVFPPASGEFRTPVIAGSGATVGGSVSPDGRMLAFTASDTSGRILLWVRPLDALTPRPLPGTDDAALPFWSPDSRSIGFFASGSLKRIDLPDGTPRPLCEVSRGLGGTWNRDGIIVFAAGLGTGLSRIQAAGGDPQAVTVLGEGQRSHRFPFFLPDGRRFLYFAEAADVEDGGVFVGDLDGNGRPRLLETESAAVYARSGHLLFVRQGILFAQPFDDATLRLVGDSIPVAEPVPSGGASPAFSASDAGVLTYRTGATDQQQFGWFDRRGQLLETVGEPGAFRGVDLAPDGARIAVHRHDRSGGDIWVFHARGASTRVTFDATQDNSSPVWSPDGTGIAFASLRNGRWALYQKPADATDTDTLLVQSERPLSPASWSRDGRYLVYWLHGVNGSLDHWLLPLTSAERQPAPLLQSRFGETHAQVSPDGKWIAYASNPTGRLEVYVRPFPSGDGVFQVSTTGGVTPRWRGDSSELFYATSYDRGVLMSVAVDSAGATLTSGLPRKLFDMGIVTPPHSTALPAYHTYAVSPDGQRFLMARPVGKLGLDAAEDPITVVLNWLALLER